MFTTLMTAEEPGTCLLAPFLAILHIRKQLDLGVTVRTIVLTTIPDSTSQKFLLLGTSPRTKGGDGGRHALVFLDFAPLQTRQCKDNDFERWYARGAEGKECLMGHKVGFDSPT